MSIRPLPSKSERALNSMLKQLKEKASNGRRIYILGLGNLGQYVAYSLKKHNFALPLRMVIPSAAVLKKFQNDPRIMYTHYDGFTKEESRDISSQGTNSTRQMTSLILSTHPSQAATAIKPLVRLLGKDSEVLFLHQGFGVIEEVLKLFPDRKKRPRFWMGLCRAKVTSPPGGGPFSIYLEKPGPLEVGPVYGGEGEQTGEGEGGEKRNSIATEKDNADNPTISKSPETPYLLQQLLGTPSLDVKILPAKLMYLNQLEKLAIQAVLHGTAGLFGCTIGQLRESAERQRILRLITNEVCQVIHALIPKKGYSNIRYRLQPKNLKSLIDHEMGQQENNWSLLQKWEPVLEKNTKAKRNYPTELNNGLCLEDVNGYIVKKGNELGIPVQNNEIMLELLRAGRTLKYKQADRYFYAKKDWEQGRLEPSLELPPRRWRDKQWSWS